MINEKKIPSKFNQSEWNKGKSQSSIIWKKILENKLMGHMMKGLNTWIISAEMFKGPF